MKSVLVRLREYRNQASVTEKTIITYILKFPKETAELTIYQLAEATFASPASIIRMCQKNGFEGYKDFIKALLYELAIRNHNLSQQKKALAKADSIEDIIEKTTYKNMIALEDTKSIIDFQVIAKCIDLLRISKNICLFGIGSSLLVAKDAQLKLMRLNKRCTVNDDWHVQLLTAKYMSPEDLGIILSYSGQTVEMIQCAKAMKESGVTIIAITRYGPSPIAELADYTIFVAANEPIIRSGAMSSRISQLNIIDILYTGYLNTQYEQSLEQITKTHIQKEPIMIHLETMSTEEKNSRTQDLDLMSIREALLVMNDEDARVAAAIRPELPHIETIIAAAIHALENEGRLIYLGAGTSGRLGLLDAVECPPTFGTPPEKVVGLLAGGVGAFIKAAEGAEDSETLGAEDLKRIGLTAKDVVIGIAASGRTPYVAAALNYAKKMGCVTAAIACNKNSEIGAIADHAVEIVVGPEVLTGSTRLKAGTAQKMVLNMISTLSMVGIGKVYKNLMVDVQQTNKKLEIRAENIIMEATDTDRETAQKRLSEANGSVKLAIIMILLGCDATSAAEKLRAAKGHIRKALK